MYPVNLLNYYYRSARLNLSLKLFADFRSARFTTARRPSRGKITDDSGRTRWPSIYLWSVDSSISIYYKSRITIIVDDYFFIFFFFKPPPPRRDCCTRRRSRTRVYKCASHTRPNLLSASWFFFCSWRLFNPQCRSQPPCIIFYCVCIY